MIQKTFQPLVQRAAKAKSDRSRKRGFPVPSAKEINVSSKTVFEARQIRDAEKADPGIVERTLDEQLERGEEPRDFHHYHVSMFSDE